MPDPSAEPLDALVTVQPGSVVSRVLLRERTGNVTLFAFGAGEGLSEHTTPHHALVVVLEGRAEIDIAGTRHAVAAGETITLPPDVPHAVHAATDLRMLLVMLKRTD